MIDRTLLIRTLMGIVIVFVVVYTSSFLLRDPIVAVSEGFIERWGLYGLVGGTLIADTSPLPLTSEPLMVLGLGAEMKWSTIFWAIGITSTFCGGLGWFLGRGLDRWIQIGARFRANQPDTVAWIERYGAWGVAVAALLPIPYALSTWTAGALSVPLRWVLIASLMRLPRTGFYLWIVHHGWSMGA